MILVQMVLLHCLLVRSMWWWWWWWWFKVCGLQRLPSKCAVRIPDTGMFCCYFRIWKRVSFVDCPRGVAKLTPSSPVRHKILKQQRRQQKKTEAEDIIIIRTLKWDIIHTYRALIPPRTFKHLCCHRSSQEKNKERNKQTIQRSSTRHGAHREIHSIPSTS